MSTMTIRNIDDDTKQALRLRAARNGVSMEQEARDILRRGVYSDEGSATDAQSGKNWYRSIRELVEPHGGFDIEIPPRSRNMREPPTFD